MFSDDVAQKLLLSDKSAYARSRARMIDLGGENAGQMGFAPNLSKWQSNQSYVRRNLIPILLDYPKGFDLLQNPDAYIRTLINLVELDALSIEGFNMGLEVSTEEMSPVGGAGEMHEDFTDVKRSRSNPSFRWNEKYGMPIFNFFQDWITFLMADPNTKVALAGTLPSFNQGGKPIDNWLADKYTMSCLFIEPDPTHRHVIKAFLCTNMMPKGTGSIEAKRDITSGGEKLDITVEFTSITQVGLGVNQFAQTMLDKINITGASPYARQAFMQGREKNLESIAAGTGYSAEISELTKQQVTGGSEG